MAAFMATITTKALPLQVLLLLAAALATLASRSGPAVHHGHAGHGPKHHHSLPAAAPSSPTTPAAPAPAAPTTAELVRATCNSTTYYDLCVSALGADPSSATADVRGLSSIAVSAAATNASGGAATAAALANGTNSNNAPSAAASSNNAQAAPAAAGDATVQALLRTCAAKYGSAGDALSAARESIAAQDYDFASVHVSAAAEYPQVCKTLFRQKRPGQYPAELAAREEALAKLCAVASDIIALVSNTSS